MRIAPGNSGVKGSELVDFTPGLSVDDKSD
jgi:hypothetical protein